MSSTLKLTLKKKWFDLMVTGEKTEEFRAESDWILSRLVDRNGCNKNYDFVEFTNGYGSDKPWFKCEFLGWNVSFMSIMVRVYSDGSELIIPKGTIVISLGKIVETRNINPPKK